jgi:Flp pilus assembly protein TadD
MTKIPTNEPKKMPVITGSVNLGAAQKSQADNEITTLLKQIAGHMKAKEYSKLEPVLQAASQIAPNDPRVLHFQGLNAFEKRDAATAFAFLRRALRKRRNDPTIQHNMAAVLISLGNFDKAEELLHAAVALKPDYAEAYHTLAPIRKFTADDPLSR